jgi:hypothetical protein
MKEWKLRQEIYHRTNPPHDFIENKKVIVCNRNEMYGIDFIAEVICYFLREDPHIGFLYYPQKSYAVAIIYAKLIQRYFKEDFYELLNDPMLLYGNDKHFVPYEQDVYTYNAIINQLAYRDLWDFEHNPGSQVQETVRCFKEEFMLVE